MTSNTFDKSIALLSKTYDKLEALLVRINSSRSLRYASWSAVLVFIFAILLLLNYLTPMIADDFGYLVVYRENTPIHSLSDIFRSQYNHYMLWGGRSVVHFIAQVLLMLPPLVIDLLNTLVYLLYIYLIYWHIKGHTKHSLPLFLLVNTAVWIIQPAFGDTILWTIGSANYLWGTTIILLFLLPFRLYKGDVQSKTKLIVGSLLMFVFAILAGWTNENTAAAMLFACVLFFVYYRSMRWPVPIWGIAALIGALVGYVFMILAPGNALRAGEAGELSLFLVCYRLLMYSMELIVSYGFLSLLYILLLVLYWNFTDCDSIKKSTAKLSFIYIAAALAGVYVMIFSPSFPPRAWFGVLTYYIIAIGIIYYNLNAGHKFIRMIRLSMQTIGLIMFFFLVYSGVKEAYSFFNTSKARETEIARAKTAGLKECEFERYVSRNKFVHSEDETANFLMWDYYDMQIWYKGQERYK